DSFYNDALAALNSTSRIPRVRQRGDFLYNFWRDEQHPRGLYRRTTLDQLRRDNPEWEVVLDIDEMSVADDVKWVFKGIDCLPDEYRHCLMRLSPGGGDASTLREFDMETLEFVHAGDGGFVVPVAKNQVDWVDRDTLFLGTDFGEGSMTDSGYPRIAKLWKRGTAMSEARTLYEGAASSIGAGGTRYHTDDGDIDLITEGLTFWNAKRYHLVGDELHELELPETARIEDGYQGKLIISLKEDWRLGEKTLTQGSVVIVAPESLYGETEPVIEVLVEPTAESVVEAVDASPEGILVTMLENVRGKLHRYRPVEGGGWESESIPFPDNGALSVASVDTKSGNLFVEYENFNTPPTLYHVSGPDWHPEEIKTQDATFDGGKFEAEQHFATSADGTRVPYFVVASRDLKLDGTNPTHIFSYGGFRVSLTPSYSGSYEALSGAYGKLWLERGGVFVLANIRGGGEFGPGWHAAALLKNRHKAFEDFEAVAEDLIARDITSPEHLGIEGRSNGGLLVGAAMTRRPDLWGAVVCGVPLSDMKRYHQLLAGASWMAEYGDPDDPDMWSYIQTYSPYQNLGEGTEYPPVFFFTSTRDDRVHPGHARKMAAKMLELGQETWYYENTEGGHGGSSTNDQLAYRLALAYSHLWSELADPQVTVSNRPKT
ncbi:MAG: prolyl oligopeptidase family serine peptidase, partial [Acidobacteriota bacterium]|nr:prolyl oligopeptidase family serine peptidase [Acidobacteriota bacterium]